MANELASVTVAPAAAPEAPAPTADLPEPVAAVASGQLPAIVVPPARPKSEPDPVYLFLVQNYDVLPEQAPVDFYETREAETILFNTQLLSQERLAQAEKDGTLAQLLTPVEAPAAAPSQTAEGTSIAPPAVQTPAQSAPRMPAGAQNSLAGARVRNMQGGPKVSPIQPNPIGQQLARRAV